MVTAQQEDVVTALLAELGSSQKPLLAHLQRGLPDMCPKAYRWVGEMEEISKTHVDSGLPGGMFAGAAAIYSLIEESPLGAEVVENRQQGTSAEAVAEIIVDYILSVRDAAD